MQTEPTNVSTSVITNARLPGKKIRQNWVLNYVKIKRIPVENGRATVKQWQKCTNRIHTHEPNNSGPDPLSVTVCATLLSCSIHKDVSKFTLAGEQTF